MKNGKLVFLEGMDGCGKSTQLKLLEDHLSRKKERVYVTREPGGTPLAERGRNLLLDPSLNLSAQQQFDILCLTRRLSYLEVILPHLREGHIVLSDRSFPSSLVYQGIAGGLNIDEIVQITREVIEYRYPDLTLIFDVDDIKNSLRRAASVKSGTDSFEKRNNEYFRTIQDGYRRLPDLMQRYGLSRRTELIPFGDQPTVQARVRELVDLLI